MTKRQMIDEILQLNPSAEIGFLAEFGDEDLHEYLQHLHWAQRPRLQGDPHRYDRYFTTPSLQADVQTDSAVAVLPAEPTDEELDKFLDETLEFQDVPSEPDSEENCQPVTGRNDLRSIDRNSWLF